MFLEKIYKTSLLYRIMIFSILWFLSFQLNYLKDSKKTNTLKEPGTYQFLLFHHWLSVYLLFGAFLFDIPHFYLFASLSILLHWLFNNNQCELTVLYNERMGFEKNRLFHDLLWQLNITEIWSRTFAYVGLVLLNIIIILIL